MKKMMNNFRSSMIAAFAVTGLLITASSCKKEKDAYAVNPPAPVSSVLKASGDSLGIVGTINQFRSVLGDSLNTTPGKTSGRREVNWDGVPASFTNNNSFPLDFFNLTDPAGANGRKRGLVYLNTGSPLRLDSSNFAEIDAAHANEFIPFSRKKTIIAANSNVSEIVFKVAGTATDAFVKGFGIIFSDVDDANSSSLEFFNGSTSLGVFKVPAKTAAGSFSFLGVFFPNEKVTRIKITAGNSAFAAGVKDVSDNGSKDLVVYDDFFYDEPKQNL
jgi:hypothetical protein